MFPESCAVGWLVGRMEPKSGNRGDTTETVHTPSAASGSVRLLVDSDPDGAVAAAEGEGKVKTAKNGLVSHWSCF